LPRRARATGVAARAARSGALTGRQHARRTLAASARARRGGAFASAGSATRLPARARRTCKSARSALVLRLTSVGEAEVVGVATAVPARRGVANTLASRVAGLPHCAGRTRASRDAARLIGRREAFARARAAAAVQEGPQRQKPWSHCCPVARVAHCFPPVPHAPLLGVVRQRPLVSQQPVAHVVGLHPVGLSMIPPASASTAGPASGEMSGRAASTIGPSVETSGRGASSVGPSVDASADASGRGTGGVSGMASPGDAPPPPRPTSSIAPSCPALPPFEAPPEPDTPPASSSRR
jgi:hypothetical protein